MTSIQDSIVFSPMLNFMNQIRYTLFNQKSSNNSIIEREGKRDELQQKIPGKSKNTLINQSKWYTVVDFFKLLLCTFFLILIWVILKREPAKDSCRP